MIFSNDKSLKLMVEYSYGMPLAMQQIGESIFWLIEDNVIDYKSVLNGIIIAAMEIGNKQIRSTLNKIRSKYYESILLKIAYNVKFKFKKSEIAHFLDKNEKKVLSDCLIRVKELGMIESIGRDNSGEYEFSNRLYFIYFMILSRINKFKYEIVKIYNEELDKGIISNDEYNELVDDLDLNVDELHIN